jgi:hypothetical protein
MQRIFRESLIVYRNLGSDDSEEEEANDDADLQRAEGGMGSGGGSCHGAT